MFDASPQYVLRCFNNQLDQSTSTAGACHLARNRRHRRKETRGVAAAALLKGFRGPSLSDLSENCGDEGKQIECCGDIPNQANQPLQRVPGTARDISNRQPFFIWCNYPSTPVLPIRQKTDSCTSIKYPSWLRLTQFSIINFIVVFISWLIAITFHEIARGSCHLSSWSGW